MNILLVDEFSTSCDIRGILEQEDFSCEVANSTVSAMSMAIRSEPDLLILVVHEGSDVSSKQAIDLCKEVKAWVHHLKMIIIAEGADYSFRESAYVSGVDDFIDSSYSAVELIARLNTLLGKQLTKSYEGGSPVASKTMVLYPSELKLCIRTRDNKRVCVELTKKESELLRVLMKNPDTVIERSALIDRFWEGDRCSRSLDNYIVRIRCKLKEANKYGNCIHTVHGVGYSFSEN